MRQTVDSIRKGIKTLAQGVERTLTEYWQMRARALWQSRGARQGLWMLTATVLSGGLNYLVNMAMGRMLGPADYSVYAALLTLHTTLMTLTGVGQTVVTNYAAQMAALGAWDRVRRLAGRAVIWCAPLGVGAAALIFVGAGLIARALQLPALPPVYALAAAALPLALVPAALGLTRGLQRFGAFGGAQIGGAAARVGSGILLVSLGLGATGAVFSLFFATAGVVLAAGLGLPELWRGRRAAPSPASPGPVAAPGGAVGRFVAFAALGMVSYALLTGMDVLIVKARFPATEAGLYAAVATVGKIALWVPGALTFLLLPKVAAGRAAGRDTVKVLRATQGAALALCGAATVVFFVAGPWVMRVLFGDVYVAMGHLLGLYGVAMTLYALVAIWLNYFLALEQVSFIGLLVLGTILQAAGLLLASTPNDIIVAIIISGLLLAIMGEVILFYVQRTGREREDIDF